MLTVALAYHSESLCVVPVKPRDKAVALATWEEYHARQSTREEVTVWFSRNPQYNIGLVHGVNGFVSIDVDHDAGILDTMRARFPSLLSGRVEQSGSGKGYHIPLFVADLPDLGWDNSKQRPKGNKTWHSARGDVNIRARWCQTVAPPSIHPSGGVYRFVQSGDIVRVNDLSAVIAWLNSIDPSQRAITPRRATITQQQQRNDTIKDFFPDLVRVFQDLGVTGDVQRDASGGIRIVGHGGLVIDEERQVWYCFSDETGGDVIDAFGWVKFGSSWDRHNKAQFVQAIRDMRERAGIGDVRATVAHTREMRRYHVWGQKLRVNYWGGK